MIRQSPVSRISPNRALRFLASVFYARIRIGLPEPFSYLIERQAEK